ncbi:hypothetical protein ATCC27039_04000 [Actinomyces naeslundii]|nr:hypothetical protein ATCC27039_04000 [Actinomyces naeslundii]
MLGQLHDPVLTAMEVTQDRQTGGVPQDVEQGGHGGGLVHGAVVLRTILGEQSMFHRHTTMLFVAADDVQGVPAWSGRVNEHQMSTK